jgi:hypothetical protein
MLGRRNDQPSRTVSSTVPRLRQFSRSKGCFDGYAGKAPIRLSMRLAREYLFNKYFPNIVQTFDLAPIQGESL